MIRRSQRCVTDADIERLLAAMGQCRNVCISVLAKAPIRSDLYVEAGRLLTMLDSMAEALTGDRQRFWKKWH